mmetsp:Transcript_11838/g.28978  ORF Transcript_11838/g.28978 Transcript_11838/m.28978 type:complete len:733 (-) Transcript_11838:180-2378(-)
MQAPGGAPFEAMTARKVARDAKEEAMRLRERAMRREEEALARAREANVMVLGGAPKMSQQAHDRGYAAEREDDHWGDHGSPSASVRSPMYVPGLQDVYVQGLQEMTPLGFDGPHGSPKTFPSFVNPASTLGNLNPSNTTAYDASIAHSNANLNPFKRPTRLPPLEIEQELQHPGPSRDDRGAKDFVISRPSSTSRRNSDPPSPSHAGDAGLTASTEGSVRLRPPPGSAGKTRKPEEHSQKEPPAAKSHRSSLESKEFVDRPEGFHVGSGDSDDDSEQEHDGGYTSKSETEDGRRSPGSSSSRRKKKRKGIKSLRRPSAMRTVRPTVKVHKLNEMGEIVDRKGHRAWEMASGLQLGIRVMLGMNNKQNSDKVEFDTFQEHYEHRFPPGGSSITPPHDGGSFKFKDYAPAIFKNLRDIFGIDAADYMVALCNTRSDGVNALRIMGTPGKSGSLFFFSHDMRFIVKTLPKREAHLLREILPNYYQHVKQNPGTYLPRFYGLHRWAPEYGRRKVRFVVMNNVFATNLAIHKRFDLKGSKLGRNASQHEKSKGHRAILKDLDCLEQNFKIRLGPARKKAFLDQIRSDCHLLMSLKIMDFSLLLGMHDRKQEVQTLRPDGSVLQHVGSTNSFKGAAPPSLSRSASDKAGDVSPRYGPNELPGVGPGGYNPRGVEGETPDGQPTDERYYMGIIDILMLYTRRKKMERVWKTMAGGEGVSSQPPAKYAIRFCNFLEQIIE